MSTNRREFIRNLSFGAAGLTVGGALAGFKPQASGAAGANERVNLACCGIGNQGGSDVMSFYNTGLCNIVAFCDFHAGYVVA